MINDFASLKLEALEDDNSQIIYYDDLEEDELILLQGYNYLCIQQDPENRMIYEAKNTIHKKSVAKGLINIRTVNDKPPDLSSSSSALSKVTSPE